MAKAESKHSKMTMQQNNVKAKYKNKIQR